MAVFLGLLFALGFGVVCMALGFYAGYLLSENKNLKEILDQYEDEDIRMGLERMFGNSPENQD